MTSYVAKSLEGTSTWPIQACRWSAASFRTPEHPKRHVSYVCLLAKFETIRRMCRPACNDNCARLIAVPSNLHASTRRASCKRAPVRTSGSLLHFQFDLNGPLSLLICHARLGVSMVRSNLGMQPPKECVILGGPSGRPTQGLLFYGYHTDG